MAEPGVTAEEERAVLQATAATLRYLAAHWGEWRADDLLGVADVIDGGRVGPLPLAEHPRCPLCTGISCDADCPLWVVRG